jgi:uncharacterized protein YdeI (YjbR/CyaY-like superfamily)
MVDREATIEPADASAWEAWLDRHHATADGVWLRIAKKRSHAPLITLPDALDVALCFGWIDSHRRGLDAESYLQRYSPRRATSPWSAVNARRAEALIAACRMRPPGLAAVEAARADGRWAAAYASQREFAVPGDVAVALDRDARARAAFDALGRTDQYALVLPVLKAAPGGARARQVERLVADVAAGVVDAGGR